MNCSVTSFCAGSAAKADLGSAVSVFASCVASTIPPRATVLLQSARRLVIIIIIIFLPAWGRMTVPGQPEVAPGDPGDCSLLPQAAFSEEDRDPRGVVSGLGNSLQGTWCANRKALNFERRGTSDERPLVARGHWFGRIVCAAPRPM